MDGRAPITRSFEPGSHITPAMEDYLKAIHRLATEHDVVTNQLVMDEIGVSGASVSNMLRKLHDLKLIIHERYRGVTLTPDGESVALEVIRHHRLLELFLARALGMDIDLVHAEADRLEHHVSEELESRIEAALGYPTVDPHGHPIPSRQGEMDRPRGISLVHCMPGDEGVIGSIDDRDAHVVKALLDAGLEPGAAVSIERIGRGDRELRVNGATVTIENDLAQHAMLIPSPAPLDEA